MNNFDLILKLFIQLGIILLFCRLVTYIGVHYFRQTPVVSEMVAGALLGPSLFGYFLPDLQQWIFPNTPIMLGNGHTIPNQSMTILFAFSQIGVAIYMFIVGLEFNSSLIYKHYKSAAVIMVMGILVPLILGIIAAYYLYHRHGIFGEHISLLQAMLFMGTCLSITAFPMLARILYENNIANTRLGTILLSAGAMDDMFAWCLLALILATLKNNAYIAISTTLCAFFYILFMMTWGRRIFLRLIKVFNNGHDRLQISTMTLILSIVMFCAFFTDYCGVYAIFGAFVAGISMPRNEIINEVKYRIEYLTSGFLVPIFFVYSGLNTQIALINSPELILITFAIIAIAILGKGGGCFIAAKLSGESWNNSLIIGTLMNARGLIELILLNIGLTYGIITPTLFTMLVLMALATTLMASPLYYYLSEK